MRKIAITTIAALGFAGSAFSGPTLLADEEMDKMVAGIAPLSGLISVTPFSDAQLDPPDEDSVSDGYILPIAACAGSPSNIIDAC